MFERFDLLSVFLTHFRAMSYRDDKGHMHTHWPTIAILIVVTSSAAGFTVWAGSTLRNATAFLSASALASGVLLAVFAQLATLRSKLSDQQKELAEQIDEGVAHIFAAEALTLLATAALTLGLMLSCDSSVHGVFAVVAISLLTYAGSTVLMLLPNLLWAYSRSYDMDRHMDGFRR